MVVNIDRKRTSQRHLRRMASQTKAVKAVQNFLAGHVVKVAGRYSADISPRTQPPPHIKEGFAHKLNANYYHARDKRRAHAPPVVAYVPQQKRLESPGESVESPEPKEFKFATPGDVYVPQE